MVSRRRLLLGAAAFVSGCTARQSPPSSSPSTTTTDATPSTATNHSPTSSRTPSLDCSSTTATDPPAATDTDGVTPPAYPEPPTSYDSDSVAAFVSAYETAYVVNALVVNNPDAQYVDAAVSESPPVTRTDRGFVVDLAYTYAVEAETPADFPPRHVAYLVRDGVLARTTLEADESPTPFPLDRATVFRCTA